MPGAPVPVATTAGFPAPTAAPVPAPPEPAFPAVSASVCSAKVPTTRGKDRYLRPTHRPPPPPLALLVPRPCPAPTPLVGAKAPWGKVGGRGDGLSRCHSARTGRLSV